MGNSLRTEDIPVGQWLVLISLLLGIVGYVRYHSKTKSTPERYQSVSRKKKDRKKSTHHSNRRKGKGHSNNNKRNKINSPGRPNKPSSSIVEKSDNKEDDRSSIEEKSSK